MVGIGPFIPHHDTPFKDEPSGTADLTTYMISILRLMNHHLLLPSTTALGTIDPTAVKKESWPAPMWSCRTSPRLMSEKIMLFMTTRSAPEMRLPNV